MASSAGGSSGRPAESGGGAASTCWRSTAMADLPVKGIRPVSISWAMMPRE